jgi:hypothetical protein
MGHRDVGNGANNAQANHHDDRNQSFESILPDGNVTNGTKNINFNADEKEKICASFENTAYDNNVV